MSEHAFTFLADDLAWIERATEAVIDDWDACTGVAGWDKYWARVGMVQAAERSVRREGVKHCVFGPGESCQHRMIHNCYACAPLTLEEVAARRSFHGMG